MCLFNIVLDEEEKATHGLADRQAIDDRFYGMGDSFYPDAHATAVNINICLALTAILSIRFKSQDPVVNNRPLSPLMTIILNKLSASFVRLGDLTAGICNQYGDALLWISLVAAIVEHRHRETLAKQDVFGVWCERLGRLMQAPGIATLKELRNCLYNFPFSEDETPLPSEDWLVTLLRGEPQGFVAM